jgi:hypothetical protein
MNKNELIKKIHIDELFQNIHDMYESHDGGAIYLPEEKENYIKQLLSDQLRTPVELKQSQPCTQPVVDDTMKAVSKDVRPPKVVREIIHKHLSLSELGITKLGIKGRIKLEESIMRAMEEYAENKE